MGFFVCFFVSGGVDGVDCVVIIMDIVNVNFVI